MPTIPRFDPPGFLDDFDRIPGQREGWSRYISSVFAGVIRRVEQGPEEDDPRRGVGAGNSQLYDETLTSSEEPIADRAVQWFGFPQTLVARFGRSRALRMADEPTPDPRVSNVLSRIQDEYLEWQVTGVAGKITRVTFTCEGPEYWQSIAGGPSFYDRPGESPSDLGAPGDRGVLVDLYRELLETDEVREEDLFYPDRPEVYNPWNVWNTTRGIVHLQQINNTLGAEITIAGDGTILRDKEGEVTDATRLICCGGFGGPERASDPHLGDEVNNAARQGYAITLRNPVGIYMAGLDDGAITKPGPDGDRVRAGAYWRAVRPKPGGDPELTVRAVYEVPQGELGPDGQQLTVSDLQIAGVPIQFGGQLAEKVTMQFFARLCRAGTFHNPALPCRTKCCRDGGILAVRDLVSPCPDVFPAQPPPPTTAATLASFMGARVRGRALGGPSG